LDTIPCSLSDEESLLLEALQLDGRMLGEVCKTFRGLGVQGSLQPAGAIGVVGGRDLERWGIRSVSGFLEDAAWEMDLERFQGPKLVFQNIIAHIANPKPRIRLIGAYDNQATVTLDTVNNIVGREKGIDLFAILALLHSDVVNWFVSSAVYNQAIRTMHFDQYFLDKIPLPKSFDRLQPQLSQAARRCVAGTRQFRRLLDAARRKWTDEGFRGPANNIMAQLAEAATATPASPAAGNGSMPAVAKRLAERWVPKLRECWRGRNRDLARINQTVQSAYGVSEHQQVFKV
jgi:hypothetical protein